MNLRGKEVVYSLHLLDKLFREDHLDVVNNILLTGKWEQQENMFKVTSRSGIILVVKELVDKFKVITIGGKYEEIYKM